MFGGEDVDDCRTGTVQGSMPQSERCTSSPSSSAPLAPQGDDRHNRREPCAVENRGATAFRKSLPAFHLLVASLGKLW
jgi:hypothetical protein